ncbi:Crp/Fnr family transcriptional regulator [Asanoa sp. WMMD1127]|uniref:Crp/Fnr family transcriptional regulator n=1 Tax=Asanoa sp. WMMD1127 TaxID=3016107 RepID=UPI0024169B70|nr:Crp/Fnr family transcriptional regulator [Asanoa sp. WMMD1127]MDG4826262.1 Crp/Fnr family transcriptional regulator [Asanoa sp. WMMD1127]
MADDSARAFTATLSRCPLFRGLPPGALADLSAQVTPFTVSPGSILWNQGDEPLDLVVVQSGLLCEFQPSASGRRSVLHVKGPPHAVGDIAVFDRRPHLAAVETLRESVILAIPAEPVVALAAASVTLTQNVITQFAGHVRSLAEQRADLMILDLARRVAKALLRMARHSDPMTVDIGVTVLANLAGGARQSVSAVLSRLERRGWLALEPGRILLLDVAALRRYVGLAATNAPTEPRDTVPPLAG